MAKHHQRSPKEPERDRLGEALRGLEKLKAPWYFDAQLQQRLNEFRHRKSLILRRPALLPAYALSVLTLVVAGTIGYYTLIQPGISPESPAPGSADSLQIQQPPSFDQQKETRRRPPEDLLIIGTEQKQRGPAAPGGDASSEPKLPVPPSGAVEEGASEAIRAAEAVEETETRPPLHIHEDTSAVQDTLRQVADSVLPATDSTRLQRMEKDSLQAPPDSASNKQNSE